METTTLVVAATLVASPEEIFEILTSSARHSELTQAESVIEGERGGTFSYFGGGVSGVFKDIEPCTRIVQELRAASWPEGHHAELTYDLVPVAAGQRTQVKIVERGVPSKHLDEVVEGWQGYWESFATYLRGQKVDVVHRFVEEYKNNHNPDVVDELVAVDCAVHSPLPGLPGGREGMRVNGKMVCGAFPDVHVTNEFVVTEGDIVIERAEATATHQGELLGTPATGAKVSWTELHAYRVRDGVITEVWSEADFVGILGQIGAIQLPAN